MSDERDIQAVTSVIRSGQWGGFPYPGPQSRAFAKSFVEMQGGQHAVLMANGTVTIEVALRAAGVGWGDEVITSAYGPGHRSGDHRRRGDPRSWQTSTRIRICLSPQAIEQKITPRTRAIVPVHLGAQMADMDAILALAEQHHLVVVEDCAHAHGARWREQGAGTFGHFGSFSLQSSKILTTGEGGVLLCRTQTLADAAAAIINCGRPADQEGQHFEMGANFRMAEVQAALGNVALERFPEQRRAREAMLSYAEECLSEVPGVRLLKHDLRHTTRSFYSFIFAIDPQVFGAGHQPVCAALRAEGVPAHAGYPPLHREPLFQPWLSRLPVPSAFPEYFQFEALRFPEAERAAEHEAVWLPESTFRAGPEGIDDVAAALRKLQANAAALSAPAAASAA